MYHSLSFSSLVAATGMSLGICTLSIYNFIVSNLHMGASRLMKEIYPVQPMPEAPVHRLFFHIIFRVEAVEHDL
jgi:hypothetical protein